MDNQNLFAQIVDILAALFSKKRPAPTPAPAPKPAPKPELKVVPKAEIQHITLEELNPHKYATSEEIDKNLAILLQKINLVRNAYGLPMFVTSGLRSDKHQARLIAEGLSQATKSNHLTGLAVDIADEDGKLKIWVKNNIKLIEEIGFWFEDFNYTSTWVHFQIIPPKSKKRFYIPY